MAQKVVRGEGPTNARIMFVGEAPGRNEAEQGRPFVGRAGRFLNKTLVSVGIDRSKCYVTNVVKVRPTQVVGGKIKDRCPTPSETAKWLPLLLREIVRVKPKIVVLLGRIATMALLETDERLADVHGKAIRRDGSVFVATYHPAVAMRNRALRRAFVEDLKFVKRVAGGQRVRPVMIQPLNSDWHLHTYHSDGALAPGEVVQIAKKDGFSEIAICDHDCVGGVDEAVRVGRRLGVRVLPGIEISVNERIRGKMKIIHILGLGIDARNLEIVKLCKLAMKYRIAYVTECVNVLRKSGFDISVNDVLRTVKDSPNMAHVGRYLFSVENNRARLKVLLKLKREPIRDDAYLLIRSVFGKGFTIQRASNVIRNAGGIVVIAHPGLKSKFSDSSSDVPRPMIERYVRLQLIDGIELSSKHHDARQNEYYKKFAKRFGLIATRGSDFHRLPLVKK